MLFIDNCYLYIDIDLYLVPKSHPESKNRWAEWRLSFSMVEIALMKHLPFVHRKAYLCCKNFIKKMEMKNFESYMLKTVMLWSMDECNEEVLNADEESLYSLVHALLCKVMKGYKDEVVQHYFLPDVNLLAKYSSQDCNAIYEKLKDCQENKQFVDIKSPLLELITVFDDRLFEVLLKTFRNLEICDITQSAIVIRQCYVLFVERLFSGLNTDIDIFSLLKLLYQIKVFSNHSGLRFSNMSLNDIWVLCQSLFKFVKSLRGRLPQENRRFLVPDPSGRLHQNPYCRVFLTDVPRSKAAHDSNTIEQRFDEKIKIVEDAMKNEWWDYDEIFASLVSWINQEALKIPEDISLKFHNLMYPEEQKMQIEMFNFGLTNEMFGITTPGKYLLFLTQHIFNNIHIYDKGMTDCREKFWALFIPGKRKELQRYDRKNSISIVVTSHEENVQKYHYGFQNYNYIPHEWLRVHNNWSTSVEWTHTLDAHM